MWVGVRAEMAQGASVRSDLGHPPGLHTTQHRSPLLRLQPYPPGCAPAVHRLLLGCLQKRQSPQ